MKSYTSRDFSVFKTITNRTLNHLKQEPGTVITKVAVFQNFRGGFRKWRLSSTFARRRRCAVLRRLTAPSSRNRPPRTAFSRVFKPSITAGQRSRHLSLLHTPNPNPSPWELRLVSPTTAMPRCVEYPQRCAVSSSSSWWSSACCGARKLENPRSSPSPADGRRA